MQREIDVKARGFHVNTKHRGTNECQQEGKESEIRRREVENMKTTYCGMIWEFGLEVS
jgi:hypothetical protein